MSDSTPYSVVIVGASMSGLCMGVKLRERGIDDFVILEKSPAAAVFDEVAGLWNVALENGETIQARTLVSGLGQLNLPNTPEFSGDEHYRGESFHSARWNHQLDLSGKRVAVIGSAACALQFIPHVAREAAQLYVYQRSANYVVKREDRAYSEAEQRRFSRHPWWHMRAPDFADFDMRT